MEGKSSRASRPKKQSKASNGSSSVKTAPTKPPKSSTGGSSSNYTEPLGNTVYQFKVRDLNGAEVPMTNYSGYVLLVVNFASNDGMLTSRNISQLNRLHINYHQRGLRILAFPSNEFGGEPLENDKMKEWIAKRGEIRFEMMGKVELNGNNAAPLFVWLKEKKGGFLFIDAIKYNFTKFLVDRHGVPFARYSSLCDFETIENEMRALLA